MSSDSSRRKVPDGHKLVEKSTDVYDFVNMPLEKAIKNLKEMAKGMIDPELEERGWDNDLYMTGFRPMTEKELEQSKKRRDSAKAAAQARKEKLAAKERREYERLAKKYA